MKKLFYCLLVAFGFSLLATSCEKDPSGSDDSNIVGTWLLYKDYEEIDWSAEFKWKLSGDKIYITLMGETDYGKIIKFTDKELVVEYEDGDYIAYFKKIDSIDL